MKVYKVLGEGAAYPKPAVLTIGNFDGLHLGHRAVIDRVLHQAKKDKADSFAITFANHPAEVLHNGKTVPLLCTVPHKLKLLEEAGIENVLLLNFDKKLADESAEVFLSKLRGHLNFKSLILGHDAALGKNREGTPERIRQLASRLHFHIEYLPPYTIHGISVSSSKIRALVQSGDLPLAESLLGRRFSVYSQVGPGEGKGRVLGFPTANIEIEGLCMPPTGVYAVALLFRNITYPGVANLGIAPTMRMAVSPLLEVHLFQDQLDLYGEKVEVAFHRFLRPEQKFSSPDELKNQIRLDIEKAKEILSQSVNLHQ